MIKCVIFDCDGTLVDSEKLDNRVVVEILGERGIAVDFDEFMQRYRGVNLHVAVAELEATYEVRLGEEFIAAYRSQLAELIKTDLEPIPGVREVLEQLRLPRCVATSAPQEKMRLCLETTNLRPHFGENLFSSYDIQVWKPEPDIFLHAAKTMGFSPDECLVVEDSEVGVTAGLAAGIKTVHFNHDGMNEALPGAIHIEQMSELPALLV